LLQPGVFLVHGSLHLRDHKVMEQAPVRDQVHDFTRACRALARFAHAYNGLTDLERETVCIYIQEMEKEVGPLPLH